MQEKSYKELQEKYQFLQEQKIWLKERIKECDKEQDQIRKKRLIHLIIIQFFK